jgi:hypothetical protein
MKKQSASIEARAKAARAPRRRRRAEAIIAEYIQELSSPQAAPGGPRLATEEAR